MNFKSLLRPKFFLPLVTIIVIFVLVFSLTNFWAILFSSKSPLANLPKADEIFTGFSDLIIPPALAEENFTLIPSDSDSLGANADTAYVLTSKVPLSLDLVKSNIKIDPEFSFSIKEISSTEWQIIPDSPLPDATVVKISLSSSYYQENGEQKERDYAWAYQIKSKFKIMNTLPGDKTADVPLNTGIEINFSYANVENIDRYFSINPQVPGKFEAHSRTLVFVPDEELAKGTIYTVTIKKGLSIKGGNEALADDYQFSFETAIEKKDISNQWFYTDNILMERAEDEIPLVPISTFEQKSFPIHAQVYSFPDFSGFTQAFLKRDVLPRWSVLWEDYRFPTNDLSKKMDWQAEIKQTEEANYFNTQYIELPEKLAKGFYLVELSSADITRQVLLQITNLTAYVNVTKTDSVAWVNDLSSKQPVAGLEVAIAGESTPLGITDQSGVARFRTPEISKDDDSDQNNEVQKHLLFRKGADALIMPISFGNEFSRKRSSADYWRYLYLDRPLYQPNDTVKYWGMIKDRKNGGISDKITVTLTANDYIWDYFGNPIYIYQQEIKPSAFNAFSGEIKLANLKSGYYNLELKVGDAVIESKYLNISRYSKPAYELSLTPEKTDVFAGDPVKLKIKAAFFEGTPVPNLPLRLETPDGEQKLTTDQNGEAEFSYTKKYKECPDEYSCWPSYSSFQVAPQDAELADISAWTSVSFYGPSVRIDNKIEYPADGKAEIKFTARQWDLARLNDGNSENSTEDKTASDIKISGKLLKIKYVKTETGEYYDFLTKQKVKEYFYEQVKEDAGSFSGSSGADGVYIYRQNIEPGTSYELLVAYQDKNGRANHDKLYLYYHNGKRILYYADSGRCWPSLLFPENKSMETKKYLEGDSVKVEFACGDEPSPAGEKKYLFLRLQNGLKDYAVADEPSYEFAFSRDDIPNIAVNSVYFDGISFRSTGDSYVSYDYAKEKKLNIALATDKEKYAPGENVILNAKVTDREDKPVAAEINFNLVDEAFYALAGDTATPLDSLYSTIDSGTIFSAVAHDSAQGQTMAEKGGCFAAGTAILLADGSSKKIENMKTGDEILTFFNPYSLELESGKVAKVWEHTVAEYLTINDTLKITPEHLLFANNKFTEAGFLRAGDWLLDKDGNKVIIRSIEKTRGFIKVYNLQIDPQHTFFADGFYVHNEKGGGPRENFTDAALFRSLSTDTDGNARLEFKLPDNITSWRMTAQALTNEMSAGDAVAKIPVSLPIFIDVSVANEYLAADKPVVRLRSFGNALQPADQAAFTVQAPSLGVEKSNPFSAPAFASAYYPLPDLKLGKHDIIYNLEAPAGKDAVKLPLSVVASRLSAAVAKTSRLSVDTKISTPEGLPVTVALSDMGQNDLYAPLNDLRFAWSDRGDQGIARNLAVAALEKYYQEKDEYSSDNFNPDLYQGASGGILLLPYGSEDLEQSVRIAFLSGTGFDENALAGYFQNILESNTASKEETSYLLAGLCALGKPVLKTAEVWLEQSGLSVKEKIYLARGLAKTGANEWARSIYRDIVQNNGEVKDQNTFIKNGENKDDIFSATIGAAALGAALNEQEAKNFFAYVLDNQVLYGEKKNSENLFDLEKIDYILNTLPRLKPQNAKVAYLLNGEKQDITLTGGLTYAFEIGPFDAANLKFTSVEGKVGIAVMHMESLKPKDIEKSANLKIRKEFYVNGKKTTSFNEQDRVEVRLYPQIDKKAPEGDYQITDFLASGLMPTNNVYALNNYYDCHYWYPYAADTRQVKFTINKYWKDSYCSGDFLHYYARVKNTGQFRSEPAIIQSYSQADVINLSDSATLMIK